MKNNTSFFTDKERVVLFNIDVLFIPCCRPIISCTGISKSYFILKFLRSAIFSARRTVAENTVIP